MLGWVGLSWVFWLTFFLVDICFWLKFVYGWHLFLVDFCFLFTFVFGWLLFLVNFCIWLTFVFGWLLFLVEAREQWRLWQWNTIGILLFVLCLLNMILIKQTTLNVKLNFSGLNVNISFHVYRLKWHIQTKLNKIELEFRCIYYQFNTTDLIECHISLTALCSM